MPEQSKFSGALARLKERPPEPPPAAPVATHTPADAELVRGRGRPHGKRSNPDYQPTTVLLRKQTKKRATRLLEDISAGQDLSDLIEQLLSEWIQQQV